MGRGIFGGTLLLNANICVISSFKHVIPQILENVCGKKHYWWNIVGVKASTGEDPGGGRLQYETRLRLQNSQVIARKGLSSTDWTRIRNWRNSRLSLHN